MYTQENRRQLAYKTLLKVICIVTNVTLTIIYYNMSEANLQMKIQNIQKKIVKVFDAIISEININENCYSLSEKCFIEY